MMDAYLKKENIQVTDRTMGWEEAIHFALSPLISGGYATEAYATAAIDTAKELGPYFVISDDVALIHARPEQGALKNQLNFSLAKTPVQFKEDGTRNARLLIGLVAENATDHIEMMQFLGELLMDEQRLAQILESETAEELYDLVRQ